MALTENSVFSQHEFEAFQVPRLNLESWVAAPGFYHWEIYSSGGAQPVTGRELSCPPLAAALVNKITAARDRRPDINVLAIGGSYTFGRREFEGFGVQAALYDYIKVSVAQPGWLHEMSNYSDPSGIMGPLVQDVYFQSTLVAFRPAEVRPNPQSGCLVRRQDLPSQCVARSKLARPDCN
jgi:hypothetical protein